MVECGLEGTIIMKLYDEHGKEVYVYKFATFEESDVFTSKLRIDPALIKQECESFEKDYEAYVKSCDDYLLNEEPPEGYKIEKNTNGTWKLYVPGNTESYVYYSEPMAFAWDHYNAIKYDVYFGFIDRIKRKFPSLEDIVVEEKFQY